MVNANHKGSPRARGATVARITGALGLLGLLCTVLAGCQVITTPQPPGAMNVSYEIQYFKDGQTHISVGFTDVKLNPVEFVSGETVACNGQFLRYSVGHYIGDVPKQPSTGEYTLTYTPSASASATANTTTAGGTNSGSASPLSITVKVVDATVVITQPSTGAAVPIPTSGPLTIQYQPVTLPETNISALASDARGHFTFTLPQSESGAIAMPADNFSSFGGGPGTLTLTRETVAHPIDTGFRAVDTHFKNISQEPITWQ